jgi:hypothetical protein
LIDGRASRRLVFRDSRAALPDLLVMQAAGRQRSQLRGLGLREVEPGRALVSAKPEVPEGRTAADSKTARQPKLTRRL